MRKKKKNKLSEDVSFPVHQNTRVLKISVKNQGHKILLV